MSVNSRLKAIRILGQRKAFYRQRIQEPNCARKKTVDIEILVTSRNRDRKIMQSIRKRSRPPLLHNLYSMNHENPVKHKERIDPLETKSVGPLLTALFLTH